MLPAAFVTNEMVPKMRFVPLLSRMAAPRPVSTSSGSAQESVVRIRMNSTYTTAMAAIFATSVTVELVATAVETSSPVPTRCNMFHHSVRAVVQPGVIW